MRSKTSTTSIIGIGLVASNMLLIFMIVCMAPTKGSETMKIQGLTIASNLLTGVIGFYFGNSKKEQEGDSDK